MNISNEGIAFIKSFEGLYLKAYKDPVGVWTIGYGHTGGVKAGQTISKAQAEQILRTDLTSYELAVNQNVKVPINQNQFDALVSFAFNCGNNALRTSDLLKLLNQGKYEAAANEFTLWVYGGGRKLPGLVRRRAAEKKLFLEAVQVVATVKEDQALAQAVSQIIRSGIRLDYNSWKRVDLMQSKNVPFLITKLGELDKINKQITDQGMQFDLEMWEQALKTKTFNLQYVRSLLIKYAAALKS